jgi:hypothetical protein
MSEINNNPPSERDWTEQEREEFFPSTDAITGLPNGSTAGTWAIHFPKQPPIEWSTGAWNGPIIELDPADPFGHMESLFSSGIHVTSIVPPEQGWPVASYCSLCKKTVFMLSLWAVKPLDGDYFKINEMCVDEVDGFKHNMQFGIKDYSSPIELKPGDMWF